MFKLILIAVLMLGCGTTTAFEYERCVYACETHEGLKYVFNRGVSSTCKCNNGMSYLQIDGMLVEKD